MSEVASPPRPAVVGRGKKQDTRERLLMAARAAFCERGYPAVSMEEIAAGAQVTRVTVYRYFPGKVALAIELYRAAEASGAPRLLSICEQDYRDRTVVVRWLADLFQADRTERRMLRVFNQAAAVEPVFTARAQQLIADVIAGWGAAIPAFDVRPDVDAERRRWLEAWLLCYEILDQSNHAAIGSGVAEDPLVVELLAERFLGFVCRSEPISAPRSRPRTERRQAEPAGSSPGVVGAPSCTA